MKKLLDTYLFSDYYPFGMLLPNRHESTNEYRYGFQGQEKDDEIKGEGNSVNYKYRMHDPRIGRFFAVDPLTSNYPHYTPYSFSGNKLIAFVELEGLEEKDFMYDIQSHGYETAIKIRNSDPFYKAGEAMGSVVKGVAEGTIDGVSYFGSQAQYLPYFTEGVITGMYGTPESFLKFTNSTASIFDEWKNTPAIGFSFEKGFFDDNSLMADPSGANYLRFAGGMLSVFSVTTTFGFKFTDVSTLKFSPIITKGNLGNPFKNSSLKSIGNSMETHVKNGKMRYGGPDPFNGKGAYVNNKTGYSYHIDKGGIYGKNGKLVEGPHIDVNYSNPKPKNLPSKKKLDAKP